MTDKKSRKLGAGILNVVKVLVALAVLAGFVLWAGGFLREKVPPGKVTVVKGIAVPDGAETHTVNMSSVAPRIDVVGTTASEELVHLSARISAYVNEISVV